MNTSPNLKPDRRGFSLIELLVVIAIIAILAALLLPVGNKIRQNMALKRAQAELNSVQNAIESYKAKLGQYPPSRVVLNRGYSRSFLYYELVGCQLVGGNTFQPLDGSPNVTFVQLGNVGIGNSASGTGDDAGTVQSFLKGLKPNQYGTESGIRYLGVTIDGPGAYMIGDLNPFQYNSSNPTNNPGRYDLWVDIVFGKQTNRISNWSATRIINP